MPSESDAERTAADEINTANEVNAVLPPMVQQAVGCYEMYRTWCAADFNRYQAFTLVRDFVSWARSANGPTQQ